jgi:hypothetical protein
MRSLYGAIANTNKKEIMISVDAVYQKVLAIANKEQRGYITPQEFNLFADHAQRDIFRQYFYDLDQVKRRPGNDYADIAALIEEKIARFEVYDYPVSVVNTHGDINLDADTPDLYKLTTVVAKWSGHEVVAEKITHKEVRSSYGRSPLIKNAENTGLAAMYSLSKGGAGIDGRNRLKIFGKFTDQLTSGGQVAISYIKKPKSPNWTYVIVGESAMFDDLVPGFMNFELHESEETLLVTKILQLAGINIKDPALVQMASQEEVKKIQQEKQ